MLITLPTSISNIIDEEEGSADGGSTANLLCTVVYNYDGWTFFIGSSSSQTGEALVPVPLRLVKHWFQFLSDLCIGSSSSQTCEALVPVPLRLEKLHGFDAGKR